VLDHPLVVHKVSLMRDKLTGPKEFRELLHGYTLLAVYEVARDFPVEPAAVHTPLARAECARLPAGRVSAVAIIRAGLWMVPGFLELLPDAKVGHIGLYRDERTLEPVEYYVNLPPRLGEGPCVLLDPMLATGGSASAAVSVLKREGAGDVRLLAAIAARRGIDRMASDHPDVRVYVGAVDERLDRRGYIVPGLGDAGDRLFNTVEGQ